MCVLVCVFNVYIYVCVYVCVCVCVCVYCNFFNHQRCTKNMYCVLSRNFIMPGVHVTWSDGLSTDRIIHTRFLLPVV